MAKPYMPPMDRKRMKPDGAAESLAPVEGDEAEIPESPERGEGDSGDPANKEAHTEFLTKDFLGGKKYAPGDSITLKVKAVNDDTGEVEVECSPKGYSQKESPSIAGMDEMGMDE